jgi:hypothetical protein
VRHDPEIFSWSFTIRMARSAWLLSKRDVEVGDESQHVGPLSVEADQQVERLLLIARSLADLGGRVGREHPGHQPSVADPYRVQGCGIEVVLPRCPASLDGVVASSSR